MIVRNRRVEERVADAAPDVRPLAFHRLLPGYRPTPLVSAPALAAAAGLAEVLLKVETARLGLPAFKILGASWAVHRLLCGRYDLDPATAGREEIAALAREDDLELVAATDGNHGRAVARVAALLGIHATVFVPAGTAAARVLGIEGEGARVEEVDGPYDLAVERAAERSDGARRHLVQDTGPAGEELPGWVAEGYGTLFAEVAEEVTASGHAWPTVVFVPVGVGALAQTAVAWCKGGGWPEPPRLVGVEPDAAACAVAALEAGHPITLPGRQESILAGLNCGTASGVAWPWLRRGIDGVVTVSDARAAEAMRLLAGSGVAAGETGAAALAGALELAASGDEESREALGAGPGGRALLLVTEGVTDPVGWERWVGHPPPG